MVSWYTVNLLNRFLKYLDAAKYTKQPSKLSIDSATDPDYYQLEASPRLAALPRWMAAYSYFNKRNVELKQGDEYNANFKPSIISIKFIFHR